MPSKLKNKHQQIFILLFLFSCLAACTPSEEPVPDVEVQCETDSITYAGTIVPILEANCYTCHDKNNAPYFADGIVLEGYASLKKQVDNKKLVGALRHQPGFAAMPRSLPQLPECTIQEIEAWVKAGAPDN